MNTQPNKNSLKKLVSLAGVASASIFLSFPALALTNSNASSSNPLANNSNYRSDSTSQLLAQSPSSTQENQPSSTGGNNQTNERSTSNTNERSTSDTNERSTNDRSNRSHRDLYRPADSNGSGMRALTGGDSVKGINWPCLNNPNPNCGR